MNRGLILNLNKVHNLKVTKFDLRNSGLGRVGLHGCERDGANRFQIVRITNCTNGRFIDAAVIGVTESQKRCIRLDIDARKDLDVSENKNYDLEIRKANPAQILWWYLTTRDPYLRISSILALISTLLGFWSLLQSIL
jgi:hypothetical protein